MRTLVRIRPEHITEHRMRMEMVDLEDEDTENTIRMKGWPWVLARHSWVYTGEPDFIYRQIREVIIGLPDIGFHPESIEESIRTVEAKARNREEHEVGFSHAWVAHPMAAAVTAFMKTLVDEPPSSPGRRTPTSRRSPARYAPRSTSNSALSPSSLPRSSKLTRMPRCRLCCSIIY